MSGERWGVLAGLQLLASTGCVSGPADGERVGTVDEQITLSGFVRASDTAVSVTARHWPSSSFKTLTSVMPATSGVTDETGLVWFPWSATLRVGSDLFSAPCFWDASCDRGTANTSGHALLRAQQGSLSLATFDGSAATSACLQGKTPMEAIMQCASPNSPDLNLFIEPPTPASTAGANCSITFGEDGSSTTVSVALAPGAMTSSTFSGQSFIRSTSGPCHFQVFNNSDFSGDHATYGSGVNARVRIGADGFVNREDGGGATWRGRSVIIRRPVSDAQEACVIRVGAAGASMNLLGSVSDPPKTSVVRETHGRNCRFSIYVGGDFSGRYKYLFPGVDGDFPVGYNVRSIEVTSWNARRDVPCIQASFGRTTSDGRCLPGERVEATLLNGWDFDLDGVSDSFENWIAKTFVPVFRNDSGHPTDVANGPKLMFQVNPSSDGFVLLGQVLWLMDFGYQSGLIPDDHTGDSTDLEIRLRQVATPEGTFLFPVFVKVWDARWVDGVGWNSAQWSKTFGTANRGVDFMGTHPVIFLSHGKHHPYNDTGWDEQDSPYSGNGRDDNVDGRGPTQLPDRIVNVGNRAHPLIATTSQIYSGFFSYNVWTTDAGFCGAHSPFTDADPGCSGEVLKGVPVLR